MAKVLKIRGLGAVNLHACRKFYEQYPQVIQSELLASGIVAILQTVSEESSNHLPVSILQILETKDGDLGEIAKLKLQTVSEEFELLESEPEDAGSEKGATLSHLFQIGQTPSAQSDSSGITTPGEMILTRLSFSQIVELLKLDDPLKRTFYEIEAIKGTWSVRELKRQIGSLLFERTGLSTNKEKLIRLTNEKADQMRPIDIIRDPYVFEFTGLRPKEVVEESDLEQALLDHLQAFLLELGHGFCFEERQKRIQIGSEYYFIDLVFYHRVLKCHVLLEIKVRAFEHGDAGQLNTYVNYYRENEMTEGDQPPIGLLLCTDKEESLARYALGGMEENLFISQYQTALPEAEELQRFLNAEARRLGIGSEPSDES